MLSVGITDTRCAPHSLIDNYRWSNLAHSRLFCSQSGMIKCKAFLRDHPGLQVVGMHEPPFFFTPTKSQLPFVPVILWGSLAKHLVILSSSANPSVVPCLVEASVEEGVHRENYVTSAYLYTYFNKVCYDDDLKLRSDFVFTQYMIILIMFV